MPVERTVAVFRHSESSFLSLYTKEQRTASRSGASCPLIRGTCLSIYVCIEKETIPHYRDP